MRYHVRISRDDTPGIYTIWEWDDKAEAWVLLTGSDDNGRPAGYPPDTVQLVTRHRDAVGLLFMDDGPEFESEKEGLEEL